MDLYTDIILDHYKNPKNFGKLKNPSHSAIEKNNSCGDILEIDLIIENKIVKEVKFTGQGCAISQASASMLTEKIKGMKISELKKLNEDSIKNLLKIDISMGRIKCALLSLKTLNSAINKN